MRRGGACPCSFNSRSRMGSDALRGSWQPGCGVSIRAPAWGATTTMTSRTNHPAVSIRAPAWGATTRIPSSSRQTLFQFALPHGERRCGYRWRQARGGFNSRSRMGSDDKARKSSSMGDVSIRAPAWGATCEFCKNTFYVGVSIRAPAWGATAIMQ